MAQLFRDKGVTENADALGINAGQLFRICSLDYVNLYPEVLDALKKLREKGCRLWLLSNAQRIFTEYELRYLGLGEQLDGIYISSDFRCRKPDVRFFNALIEEQKLDKSKCLMIGNDLHTDIGGAKAAGLATFYMHTNLTPPDQRCADPDKHPDVYDGPHWEYDGYDWAKISDLISKI
jgi:putative hydrolase of the HAD superfamily